MNQHPEATTFMDDRLSAHKAALAQAVIDRGYLEDNGAISVVDTQGLVETVKALQDAFPDFNNTFAVKSNYYLWILKLLNAQGMGAEVAGPGELALARKAGFAHEHMVFDAPIKTKNEIIDALDSGIAYNIDNFQEFEEIVAYAEISPPKGVVGFRINPQIGAGEVELSSTATMTSKFGLGLKDEGVRERLLTYYQQYSWLTGIHVHVGSVGCPMDLMAKGVEEIIALAEEIDARCGKQQIRTIDIGGGLPVSFETDVNHPTFADYAKILKQRVPVLFEGKYKVLTEFGRSVIAKNAFTIAKVEYSKTMGGRHIALTHAGAHNMVRIVFQPKDWARRVTALHSDGSPKKGETIPQDIAGPCCFAGDIIAHQRNIPLLEPGDFVLVHDTGAYCFSNHFLYNALPPDPVVAWAGPGDPGGPGRFEVISAGQGTQQLVEAYS